MPLNRLWHKRPAAQTPLVFYLYWGTVKNATIPFASRSNHLIAFGQDVQTVAKAGRTTRHGTPGGQKGYFLVASPGALRVVEGRIGCRVTRVANCMCHCVSGVGSAGRLKRTFGQARSSEPAAAICSRGVLSKLYARRGPVRCRAPVGHRVDRLGRR